MNELQNIITYIIVTWNNEKEIENCLSSIKRYSSLEAKIIIVDNASKDQTRKIIFEKFPEVDLIRSEENLGFAAANNLALNHVMTDFVCFLNPDVILTEDIIVPSINVLKRDTSIGIVACQLKNLDGTNQPSHFNYATKKSIPCEILHIGKYMPNILRKKYFLNYYQTKVDFTPEWVIGAEMVMRTEDAKTIGGFSTEYFMYTEDMDLCKKVSMILRKKIYYLANVSLVHLGGASEVQNVNYNKQKKIFENDFTFIYKFYGKIEAVKAISNMLRAYELRLIILKLLYRRVDRNIQIEKTKRAIEILKEMRNT